MSHTSIGVVLNDPEETFALDAFPVTGGGALGSVGDGSFRWSIQSSNPGTLRALGAALMEAADRVEALTRAGAA